MKRGKKGTPGAKRRLKCPNCKKMTIHVCAIVPHSSPKVYWVCKECGYAVPANLKK